jgi:hypothetical protein
MCGSHGQGSRSLKNAGLNVPAQENGPPVMGPLEVGSAGRQADLPTSQDPFEPAGAAPVGSLTRTQARACRTSTAATRQPQQAALGLSTSHPRGEVPRVSSWGHPVGAMPRSSMPLPARPGPGRWVLSTQPHPAAFILRDPHLGNPGTNSGWMDRVQLRFRWQ